MSYELLLMNIARNASERSPHFRECLGQHLIASYVEQYGYSVRVYSGDVLECEKVLCREIEFHKVRMIGFYIGADTLSVVINVIKWLKKKYSVTVFVGGPEAYATGKDFLKSCPCDYVIPGEGEKPVLGLLKYVIDGYGVLKNIRSLRYCDDTGTYYENALEEPIQDLDSLPFPKRKNSLNKTFRMNSSIGILTGRGCPYHCSFCFEGATSKLVRFRSIKNVIAEIEEVRKENPNLKCVNVYDDTFTLQRQRIEEFCKYMKRKGLLWTCEGHVARICHEPDLMKKMVESGLIAMQIGIESGSRKVLEAYNKNTTPEMIQKAVSICKQAGLITLEGNYIIGGAFETEETIHESIEHAKSLLEIGRGMIELSTVFFAPYCGTPITKNPEKFGITIEKELNKHIVFTMRDAVVTTNGMSTEQIIKAKQKFDEEITKKYYLEAIKCTKTELLRGASRNNRQMRINPNWCIAWERYSYLKNFMRHFDIREQTIDSHKFPVRTVSEYIYKEDVLLAGDVKLQGMDAKYVVWADGRRSICEIAEQEGIVLEHVLDKYTELNEKGYVYFSKF